MNPPSDLFRSPELLPLEIDVRRRVMTFVRMAQEDYLSVAFLDRGIRDAADDVHEIGLDDLLLASGDTREEDNPVHFILHTAFCCSTLLARYCQLLPSCFVLKEPRLLTQVALAAHYEGPQWNEIFRLSLRLLTRTYAPGQLVIIKANDWCNGAGKTLLGYNMRATITFLMMPLRHFVLSVLKTPARRHWVHTRIRAAASDAADSPSLTRLNIDHLTDAEAAAYLWLVNGFRSSQLATGPDGSRVLTLDGERIADAPRQVLPVVAATWGLSLSDEQLQSMLDHPSMVRYSKDPSQPYNANTRRHHLQELDSRFGDEADGAMEWMASHGLEPPDCSVTLARWPAVRPVAD